jgi:hypothetical protein
MSARGRPMLNVLRFRGEPKPYLPHRFTPRRHGSRDACRICGAAVYDPIHDVPKRRGDDRKPWR